MGGIISHFQNFHFLTPESEKKGASTVGMGKGGIFGNYVPHP